MSTHAAGIMPRPQYIPLADFIPIPTTHPLEIAAYRMPNGAKHVELADVPGETDEQTWQLYCAELLKISREKQWLRAFARCTWED